MQFSRDLIIPEDAMAGKSLSRNVQITTDVQSLNDSVVEDPHRLGKFKGFGITVTNAFMDWSDMANPPGLAPP